MQTTDTPRLGDFIITQPSVTQFWPLDVRPGDIHVCDIAHALSNICRWTGHVRRFWSVAAHSLLVASLVPPEFRLEALLHDAHEAYLTDIARPIKYLPQLAGYREIENSLDKVIRHFFGLPLEMSPEVKRADNIALVTEARDLVPGVTQQQWYLDYASKYPPRKQRIRPWDGWMARSRFIEEFERLKAA